MVYNRTYGESTDMNEEAKVMATNTRTEAIKAIRSALRASTGRAWSVRGDRGTAYSWIHIDAPAARLTCDFEQGAPCDGLTCGKSHQYGYLTMADREELARVFNLDRPAHPQGISISPDSRDYYVAIATGLVTKQAA